MLNLWTLEERRNRQDLIEIFKICKGYTRINPNNLFYFDNNGKGTRGHSLKLVKLRCTRNSRKHFFSNRAITRWNLMDQGAIDATCVNAIKGRLEKLSDTRMAFFMGLLVVFLLARPHKVSYKVSYKVRFQSTYGCETLC